MRSPPESCCEPDVIVDRRADIPQSRRRIRRPRGLARHPERGYAGLRIPDRPARRRRRRAAAIANMPTRDVPPGLDPLPASNGFHIGPLFFRAYGICYVFAVL